MSSRAARVEPGRQRLAGLRLLRRRAVGVLLIARLEREGQLRLRPEPGARVAHEASVEVEPALGTQHDQAGHGVQLARLARRQDQRGRLQVARQEARGELDRALVAVPRRERPAHLGAPGVGPLDRAVDAGHGLGRAQALVDEGLGVLEVGLGRAAGRRHDADLELRAPLGVAHDHGVPAEVAQAQGLLVDEQLVGRAGLQALHRVELDQRRARARARGAVAVVGQARAQRDRRGAHARAGAQHEVLGVERRGIERLAALQGQRLARRDDLAAQHDRRPAAGRGILEHEADARFARSARFAAFGVSAGLAGVDGREAVEHARGQRRSALRAQALGARETGQLDCVGRPRQVAAVGEVEGQHRVGGEDQGAAGERQPPARRRGPRHPDGLDAHADRGHRGRVERLGEVEDELLVQEHALGRRRPHALERQERGRLAPARAGGRGRGGEQGAAGRPDHAGIEASGPECLPSAPAIGPAIGPAASCQRGLPAGPESGASSPLKNPLRRVLQGSLLSDPRQ